MFTQNNNEIGKKPSRGNSLSSKKRSKLIFYISMMALPIAQFLVFYLYINFDSFALAFKEYSFEQGYVFAKFNNFIAVLEDFKTDVSLTSSIINSLELFVWTIIFGSGVAILFSYYIYKKYFGHVAFKILLYLPQILGGVVVVIMYRFFVELAIPEIVVMLGGERIEGLLTNPDTVRATIIFYTIYISFGTQVLVYSSTMSGISESLIESAQLDGITPIKELIYIILPSIWTTFVTFMVASIVGVFTNQMALFTFYGTNAPPNLYTFGYYLYRNVKVATAAEYPYLSAIGLLLTAIAVPVTLITRWALTKFGPSRE